ncbi:TIGR02221 family CRISPR-associated protein [Thermocrinis sp.]|uniref:TIGR02221 family CRISPR-associated protein n=1 Tax=Thermocrinis sp. TaxID=2024383 RepID=UPI002FDE620D
MEKSLLVSFIGGSRGKRSYENIKYRFSEEEVRESYLFGIALFEHLRQKGEDLELLFVGTTGSGWSELINVKQSQDQEIEELFDRIIELEKAQKVSDEVLSEWISKIKESVDVEIHYILLENPPELESISKSVMQKVLSLGDYKKIILDITHAYRFVPYVVLLDLMVIKKLKSFELEIYYGFLEHALEDGSRPVKRLSHLEELVKLNEALSLFENAGDFRSYFQLAGVDESYARGTYFEVEINRPATKALRNLANLKTQKQYLEPLHQRVVEKYIFGLLDDRLESRMRNRAKFFYERGQYLKAITLLYEAILVKGIRIFGLGDDQFYKNREEVKALLDRSGDERWIKFKNLRNACVHGTPPQEAEVLSAVLSEDKFKEIFELGFEIFENLTKGGGNA